MLSQQSNDIHQPDALKDAIDDLLDDLSEITSLAEEIDCGQENFEPANLESQLDAWLNSVLAQRKQDIARLKNRISKIETEIENGEQLKAQVAEIRCDILTFKSELRAPYRLRVERCPDPVCTYENVFLSEYASHLGSERLCAFLANSGMAAFSTVLHLLQQKGRLKEKIVAITPQYFENLDLLERYCPNLAKIQPESEEELLRFLNELEPSILFFDSALNNGAAQPFQLTSLFEWASGQKGDLLFVVDTTCLPTLLLPTGCLRGLPKNVEVLIVESLAKHHQFGLDLVTAGIVLAHAKEPMQADLENARNSFGTKPSDMSAVALPRPNRFLLTRRMRRHSRNIMALCEKLESDIDLHNGIIESVEWIREGIVYPWYRTSCMSIRFQKKYKSPETYRQFATSVLLLANDGGYPFTLGTSFGFDISRLFMTTPASLSEDPYLRLAIGTETRCEIEMLAGIIRNASRQLADKH